jgi:hypothetical protein
MRVLPILALVLGLAACGSSPPPKRPDPRPPGPGSAATPTEPASAATCDDACTQYAVCYEQVYSKDYSGGGECVTSCEEMAEADRSQYIAEWTDSGADCATLMGQ